MLGKSDSKFMSDNVSFVCILLYCSVLYVSISQSTLGVEYMCVKGGSSRGPLNGVKFNHAR